MTNKKRDVECPYCGAEQDIDHDDGSYCYCEGYTYEQTCVECANEFEYVPTVFYKYDVYKITS